jgi:hypothetical protein
MKESNLDQLEQRALEEREQIHQSVEQLRSGVTQVRSVLDPQRNARKHFLSATVIGSSVAFILGYRLAGLLVEYKPELTHRRLF